MAFTNPRDLALAVSDSRAVAIFDQAGDEVVGFQGDPVATLDRALEIDDQFVLSHCLSAIMNIIGNASSRLDEAKLSLDQTRQSVDLSTERERLRAACARFA